MIGPNGSLQVCAGQPSRIETAIHAMRYICDADDTEAILRIDASNAFNSLDRTAALHNLRILCPTMATCAVNTYRLPNGIVHSWWTGIKIIRRYLLSMAIYAINL